MSDIRYDMLGPGDYDRAKTVLNKARHPGFVGRELFYRCATSGQACIAVIDDVDAGVALIVKEKLQALSVPTSFQGRGVGAALMARTQPKWVSAIADKVPWFEKQGYRPYGAAKVGHSGKHAVQLMERIADAPTDASIAEAPTKLPPADEIDAGPSFLELLDAAADARVRAQLQILDGMMAKALLAEKFEAGLKILAEADKLLKRHGKH